MRVPSRYMPKCAPSPVTQGRNFLWLILSISVLTPFAYFAVIHPLITATLVASLVSYSHLKERKFLAHRAYLGSTRQNGSICDFSRSFDCREIDTWIIRAVYEELKNELVGIESFSLKATDRFIEDLHIDHEELEWIFVPAIAERTGRSLKPWKGNPYWGKVTSVGDLVHFFNNQPLKSDEQLRRGSKDAGS